MTDPTPAGRGRFAFLVHPRADVRGDVSRALRHPLARRAAAALPAPAHEAAFALARPPARLVGEIRAADAPDRVLGEVVAVMLTPRQLLRSPRPAVHARIRAAVEGAAARGATVVGLGALTAPATSGGTALADVATTGVTNGNAFTAVSTARAVQRLAGAGTSIALVGATGSVGSALARLLHRSGHRDLLLVGRSEQRLAALAAELPGTTTSTAMTDVRGAHLVVLLTSAVGAVLRPEHLRAGAVVLDDTQPRNTSPDLLTARPDVTVVDGGVVDTAGLAHAGDPLDLARGTSFACLAETALLALAGRTGHATMGHPTLAQCDDVAALAQRYAHLGFGLAPFTSFGRPLGTGAPAHHAAGSGRPLGTGAPAEPAEPAEDRLDTAGAAA